jgi:hypothetical protein
VGEKLPPAEMELYHRVDEVLHYLWDPIGVASCPDARDEYYSYLPQVFALVKAGNREEIERYLAEVCVDRMGLSSNPAAEKKIAAILIQYRDKLL